MTVTIKKEPSSTGSPCFVKDEDIQRNHQCATCRQRFESLDKLTKHQVKHKSGRYSGIVITEEFQ